MCLFSTKRNKQFLEKWHLTYPSPEKGMKECRGHFGEKHILSCLFFLNYQTNQVVKTCKGIGFAGPSGSVQNMEEQGECRRRRQCPGASNPSAGCLLLLQSQSKPETWTISGQQPPMEPFKLLCVKTVNDNSDDQCLDISQFLLWLNEEKESKRVFSVSFHLFSSTAEGTEGIFIKSWLIGLAILMKLHPM